MINVGLIGSTGSWGKTLQPKLSELGNLQFECSGRDPSHYISYLPHVEWVFIATPNSTHYDIARQCIDGGVNVFCEKPLTTSLSSSSALYAHAATRDVQLYVDDVFCFRNETGKVIESVRAHPPTSIEFTWRKWGSFKDHLFNALVYHDLSILHTAFGHLNYSHLEFSRNEADHKQFAFNLGETRVNLLYDRRSTAKEKKITMDGRIFDYTNPQNDALREMVAGVLAKTVDFEGNRKMCLSVDKVLGELSKRP